MRMPAFVLFLVMWLPFTSAQAAAVRVSAAASLTDALRGVVTAYRRDHPEAEVLLNFASSGALAKQLVAGAPADIYISANANWMDFLRRQELIAPASQRILVRNSLVFIGGNGSGASSLEDLPNLERIAIGSPKAAPAGQYAEQALTAAGIYLQLLEGGKLVFAKDVRQALLYADRGEADGAFVYRSDALLTKRAHILFTVPRELYPQVSYPAALLKTATNRPEVQQFFEYLFSPEAQQVLVRFGFLAAE